MTANEEEATEKEGYSQASSTQTKASLSAIPQQLLTIAPQHSDHYNTHHNTYRSDAPIATWPGISTCAMIWNTMELSKQETDLLERSQPSHHENKQDHGPNSMRMDASVSGFSRICRCSNESN